MAQDSFSLPFLDTVIRVHYHVPRSSEPKPLSVKEGQAIVERYFEKRGWLLDRKHYPHLSNDKDYPSISFDTIYTLGVHHPAQYLALYWDFLYRASSHCSQPHYSLLAWNGHGYDLIRRDFMSEFYYTDSISSDSQNDYLYGVDDDCGGKGILRRFRAVLKYN